MTLHPIAVVDQVLEEYRSYLKTEFRARDERLRQALENALGEPRFLAQEPFFQAHRPFKPGRRWEELGLDPALAQVMTTRSGTAHAYLHQSQAIDRLLGMDAGPLVVTTGTGSGKTECFLLPVLQNAIEDSIRFNRSGLTAILVYPMNALANDQAERIADYLTGSGHTHVRVGRYDRATPEEDRERWRRSPPHVLLTNYMMLEYLLVRPADRDALFANHRCRFLVLDEVHSYRGALGANIVDRVKAEVPERADTPRQTVEQEVVTALVTGAALPDGTPGALRLRTHRFIRSGWRFYRCVDPACGKLYPMGEERCACGMPTAPLYLCRSCGAHTLRFRGREKPEEAPLVPSDSRDNTGEWVLYERAGGAEADEDTELVGLEQQMKERPILKGTFDPASCSFSLEDQYPVKVVLAPGRNRCLVCGGTAGSRSVLTPVALGTSAAVRVVAEGLVEALAEQNRTKPGHDGKERLLVFADSRQDAAHQARFITYAGRYDRMRRRLVQVLHDAGQPLTFEQAVQALTVKGVERGDNPRAAGYADYLPQPVQEAARRPSGSGRTGSGACATRLASRAARPASP